jgi:glycosyltransferase involved in cell wall biosynthesis
MVAAVNPNNNHLPVVCHLLHGLRVGGAEVLAARIARRLCDEFRFVFICLDELGGSLGEGLMAEGYPVHVIGRRPGIDWRCSWRLAPLLRSHDVVLVHAHLFSPFFYGALARLLYQRPAILFTDHGRPFPDLPNRKHLLANRLLLQRRDRVVGVGQAVREGLIRNEGFPAARVGVVYNGIDLPAFTGAAADRAAVRQELGLTEDEFAILQVARLVPDKDHVTGVRAMAACGQWNVSCGSAPTSASWSSARAPSCPPSRPPSPASACTATFACWACVPTCPACWPPPTCSCSAASPRASP